ncbi:unnamed protein product, partial [Mesorhabditis belari]|uniref:G-protein coupled receptors family 1 profile domain-containing protein n=1 Tax=Mesorhabditis belari TaxID=2138241 RepID=A0AAF3EYQ5_9BILA
MNNSTNGSLIAAIEELSEETACSYEPQLLLEWKMWFVGMLGCTTALVSIMHNCILFYTFNSSKLLRRRNLTYLKWISLCDIFVSLSYIAIMCVQVYADYFKSLGLFILWHHYLVIAFTVSNITFSSSSFLLMAATIERYLQSTGNSKDEENPEELDNPVSTAVFYFLSNHRSLVVIMCFVLGAVFRGTVIFEIVIVYQPDCTGFETYYVTVSQLTEDPLFDMLWKFWVRKIFSVFLPFVVLAYFNAAIVMNVRKTDRDQTVKTLILYVTVGSKGEVTRLRSRLRTVTRMLVMVVCTYLFSNILDVIIAFWENIDPVTLTAHKEFYTVTSDISSFLPILACALRLPIYTVNDREIRMEVVTTVHVICRRIFGILPCCSPMCKRGKWATRGGEIDTTYYMPKKISMRDATRGRGMSGLIMARAQLVSRKDSFDSTGSVCIV